MRRAELLSLLGDLPPLDRPIRAERLWRDTRPHYHLEKWTLDLNGLEPVPAYVTLPLDARGPAPAVLYNHAHGSDYALGKDELLNGRSHLQAPPLRRGPWRARASRRCASTTGSSASAPPAPRAPPSSRCCGKGACCGA